LNILEIKDVSIYYNGKEILKNININVKENEILCIMGPSGCGKSTLLSLINGFLKENGGEYTGDVILKGKNIKSMKLLQLRRSVSTLFQDSKPFPLSIENNILYPIEFYEGKVKNRKERISQYLKDVNLYNEVKNDFKMSALKLSGGQKQRLCIARMLTTDPHILIFDEPCSSLDKENTLIIENLIKRLAEKYTVILTTHNVEQAERIADRTINITKIL
jgi:phosphate import ATP-binding protein pstB 1